MLTTSKTPIKELTSIASLKPNSHINSLGYPTLIVQIIKWELTTIKVTVPMSQKQVYYLGAHCSKTGLKVSNHFILSQDSVSWLSGGCISHAHCWGSSCLRTWQDQLLQLVENGPACHPGVQGKLSTREPQFFSMWSLQAAWASQNRACGFQGVES